MIAYLDSSVLLRYLLNQEGKLSQFLEIKRPISSKLLKMECLRVLDRSRVLGFLNQEEYLTAVKEFYEGLDSIEFIEISNSIMDRVGGAFPVALGTLNAIHLSSALAWREEMETHLIFLTHDESLGKAARAFGFETLGHSNQS